MNSLTIAQSQKEALSSDKLLDLQQCRMISTHVFRVAENANLVVFVRSVGYKEF